MIMEFYLLFAETIHPQPQPQFQPPPGVTNEVLATITAIAVTIGFLSQVVLQLMARAQARRAAEAANENARIAQESASAAAKEAKGARDVARVSVEKTKESQDILVLSNEKTHESLEKTRQEIKVIHKLVNNNMLLALESILDLSTRIAALTKTPEDELAVINARKALDNQKDVEARTKDSEKDSGYPKDKGEHQRSIDQKKRENEEVNYHKDAPPLRPYEEIKDIQ